MIIMSKGDAFTPARFWDWIVCKNDEYEQYHELGFVKSSCTKYLTDEQAIELFKIPKEHYNERLTNIFKK